MGQSNIRSLSRGVRIDQLDKRLLSRVVQFNMGFLSRGLMMDKHD